MHIALKDKTNKKIKEKMDEKKELSEKASVINLLRNVSEDTKDFDLKYDITKCIEILEGKENQEYIDLKGAFEEAIMEKEQLFVEKCELIVEIDYLKNKIKKHKNMKL